MNIRDIIPKGMLAYMTQRSICKLFSPHKTSHHIKLEMFTPSWNFWKEQPKPFKSKTGSDYEHTSEYGLCYT